MLDLDVRSELERLRKFQRRIGELCDQFHDQERGLDQRAADAADMDNGALLWATQEAQSVWREVVILLGRALDEANS